MPEGVGIRVVAIARRTLNILQPEIDRLHQINHSIHPMLRREKHVNQHPKRAGRRWSSAANFPCIAHETLLADHSS